MRQNVPYYEADCCMIKKKKKRIIYHLYTDITVCCY